MVKITGVESPSPAQAAGIAAGDILHTINAHEIADVLDYRFYLSERTVVLGLSREGVAYEVTIRKDEYGDIGLTFETGLMDRKRTCQNKCIFCFIDQLPGGLRPSLYFKDDDSRLSFLHGNYITLTNLHERDIDRILAMHISPVNVSVHTTNPALRCLMMGNRRAGEVLGYLDRFAKAGISVCAQIVLCRGINDGDELARTMRDLSALFPSVGSVSIVPCGMTRFREGLYPLEPYSPEECREVIRQVNAFGDECLARFGSRIFFCADEFYVAGGLPIPDAVYYEDYPQIENGVGMLRSLCDEFDWELEELADALRSFRPGRVVSVATGLAAYDTIRSLAEKLMRAVDGLEIRVWRIVNDFFGHSITVAGLLTGVDVAAQLAGKDLGEELLIPGNMLRAEGDCFLCGMTPKELSEKLGVKVTPTDGDGAGLLAAWLGVSSEEQE